MWCLVLIVVSNSAKWSAAFYASEEMNQEEFNTMRGVTNRSRVDASLYASGSGKGKASAPVLVDDGLLGTQASASGEPAAGAGDAKKGARTAGDVMYYRIVCKVIPVVRDTWTFRRRLLGR